MFGSTSERWYSGSRMPVVTFDNGTVLGSLGTISNKGITQGKGYRVLHLSFLGFIFFFGRHQRPEHLSLPQLDHCQLAKGLLCNSRNLLPSREVQASHSDKDIKFPDKRHKTLRLDKEKSARDTLRPIIRNPEACSPASI